jgi:copper chaperone CopZ
VGLPIYVCATASVPLAAAFIHMGVSPGAALVFLMTGPATNAATIATVWKTMGRRTTLIYLGTVAVTAFGSGLALNYGIGLAGWAGEMPAHEHGAQGAVWWWTSAAAAVALVGVLVRAAFAREVCDLPSLDGRGDMVTLTVAGMHCSHCVNSITRGLREVQGVGEATVSLETGIAVVRGDGLDKEALKRKVVDLGYDVTGVEENPDSGEGEAADGRQGHAH